MMRVQLKSKLKCDEVHHAAQTSKTFTFIIYFENMK